MFVTYKCRRSYGFYLTYEELKRAYIEIHSVLDYWFYLTYEELKLCYKLASHFGEQGFYLTYEELKRTFWYRIPNCCFLDFILPMRNWNLSKVRTSQHSARILSYLWGIETIVPFDKTLLILEILSYLWGIETINRNRYSRLKRRDFILPMRNWNYSSIW